MPRLFSDQQRLAAAKRLIQHVAKALDLPLSLRLWDGTNLPLGKDADPVRFFSVDDVGAFGALLRRPSLETLYRLYAGDHIDTHGADMLISWYLWKWCRNTASASVEWRLNAACAKAFPG